MRQTNRKQKKERKQSHLIFYFWEHHTPESSEKERKKMRNACHSELRNVSGAWGFQGLEGNSQDHNKEQIFGD